MNKIISQTIVAITVLLSFYNCYSQDRRFFIIDKINGEKINEVKILSNLGDVIAIADSGGSFILNINILKEKNIIYIETSNFLYKSIKIPIPDLSETIKLERKINLLQEVIIKKKNKKTNYYKVAVYFRTWRLVNNKLVNYVEGTKDVYMPFDKSKSNKEYFTQYISYKDSLFSKNYVSITFGGDGFLFTKIYPEDYYTIYKKLYSLEKVFDRSYNLIEDNTNVGYVLYDENNVIYEINKRDVVNNITILGKSLNYKNYTFERWNNTDNNRRLSMSRNTIIKNLSNKHKTNITETVTEIYIQEEDFITDDKPKKFKNIVNPDRSFYNNNFYEKYRLKYPLQKEIEVQLNIIKLNENTY